MKWGVGSATHAFGTIDMPRPDATACLAASTIPRCIGARRNGKCFDNHCMTSAWTAPRSCSSTSGCCAAYSGVISFGTFFVIAGKIATSASGRSGVMFSCADLTGNVTRPKSISLRIVFSTASRVAMLVTTMSIPG